MGTVRTKGVKYMVMGDLTLGGGHTGQYTDGESQTCTLDTYMDLINQCHPSTFNLFDKKKKICYLGDSSLFQTRPNSCPSTTIYNIAGGRGCYTFSDC